MCPCARLRSWVSRKCGSVSRRPSEPVGETHGLRRRDSSPPGSFPVPRGSCRLCGGRPGRRPKSFVCRGRIPFRVLSTKLYRLVDKLPAPSRDKSPDSPLAPVSMFGPCRASETLCVQKSLNPEYPGVPGPVDPRGSRVGVSRRQESQRHLLVVILGVRVWRGARASGALGTSLVCSREIFKGSLKLHVGSTPQ